MNELIIVGSGRSLLGSGLGKKIDSFKNILRFNGSEGHLQTYKEDVGTRTTIFALNSNINTVRRVYSKLTRGMIITRLPPSEISTVIITGTTGSTMAWTRRSKAGKRLVAHLKKTKAILEIHSHSRARKILKRYGLDPGARYSVRRRRRRRSNRFWGFTSGLIVLCNLLDRYDKIYLCGFDMLAKKGPWCRGPNQTKRCSYRGHFYDNSTLPLYRHRLGEESKVIRQLIAKTNKIEILDRVE